MKLARRILATIAIIVAVLYFIVPAGFLYFARSAPAVTRVVPIDLKDLSASTAPGKQLSYLGYQFEVPWSDLDESQTRLGYEPGMHTASFCFRSGLKLFVSIGPRDQEVPQYALRKRVYEITPDKIRYWTLFRGGGYREAALLQVKSVTLRGVGDLGGGSSPAETGIFNLRSERYEGFQFGDPQRRPDMLVLNLYSNDGNVVIEFVQVGYEEPAGVMQSEINRIVQSLRNTFAEPVALRNAKNGAPVAHTEN